MVLNQRAFTRDIFRAVLSVDEATRARGRGWALSQALIALSSYTLETNPVLVREAQRWMAEVIAAHQPGDTNYLAAAEVMRAFRIVRNGFLPLVLR